MAVRQNRNFGWHAGTVTAWDMILNNDFYIYGDLHFGDVSVDTFTITGYMLVSGTPAIGISMTGTFSTAGIVISGDHTDGILISGDSSSNMIESTGTVTGDVLEVTGTVGKVISAGAHSAFLDHQGGEMITVGGSSATTTWIMGIGAYMRSTGEDCYPFAGMFYTESTSTAGVSKMNSIQSMAFLGSIGGTEAAHLKTLGGDATAGMYSGWFKIGANPNCVFDVGSRVSVLWVDDQTSGTINGEHFGIFASTGGGKPNAFIGFNTTSSGWTHLLSWDSTSYNQDPVTALACPNSASDGSIKISLNGVTKYIPYFNTAT